MTEKEKALEAIKWFEFFDFLRNQASMNSISLAGYNNYLKNKINEYIQISKETIEFEDILNDNTIVKKRKTYQEQNLPTNIKSKLDEFIEKKRFTLDDVYREYNFITQKQTTKIIKEKLEKQIKRITHDSHVFIETSKDIEFLKSPAFNQPSNFKNFFEKWEEVIKKIDL